MKLRLVACILMLTVLCGAAWAAEQAKPVEKSKALFLVGGPYHDNPELYPILQKLLEDTGRYSVTLTRDVDQFRSENIRNYDFVIIYATRLTMNKEQEQGLIDFVASGKSLVGIHCVTDTFLDSDAYWKLVGGRFTRHGNETFKVNITGKSHPVVKGMSSFEISDETYCDNFHPEAKVVVLMRRDKDGEPTTWVQYYGKGRVFITSLGHGKPAWQNPAFQELVFRGTEWATYRLNP